MTTTGNNKPYTAITSLVVIIHSKASIEAWLWITLPRSGVDGAVSDMSSANIRLISLLFLAIHREEENDKRCDHSPLLSVDNTYYLALNHIAEHITIITI
jgi:hypothetical protein